MKKEDVMNKLHEFENDNILKVDIEYEYENEMIGIALDEFTELIKPVNISVDWDELGGKTSAKKMLKKVKIRFGELPISNVIGYIKECARLMHIEQKCSVNKEIDCIIGEKISSGMLSTIQCEKCKPERYFFEKILEKMIVISYALYGEYPFRTFEQSIYYDSDEKIEGLLIHDAINEETKEKIRKVILKYEDITAITPANNSISVVPESNSTIYLYERDEAETIKKVIDKVALKGFEKVFAKFI